MKKAVYLALFLFILSCKPLDKRIMGVYKNDRQDTLKLVDDHSFRIELMEPDSTLGQYRYSTGRWNTEKRKLHLHMDSRSMGQYWECQPFGIGWRRLRRHVQCSEEGPSMVFHKIRVKKQKILSPEQEEARKKKEEKKESKKKKKEPEEE